MQNKSIFRRNETRSGIINTASVLLTLLQRGSTFPLTKKAL